MSWRGMTQEKKERKSRRDTESDNVVKQDILKLLFWWGGIIQFCVYVLCTCICVEWAESYFILMKFKDMMERSDINITSCLFLKIYFITELFTMLQNFIHQKRINKIAVQNIFCVKMVNLRKFVTWSSVVVADCLDCYSLKEVLFATGIY